MNFKKILTFFKREKPLEIYTDGSHKGKWGAWAFVVVQNGKIIHEASGRERKTNSHRMEFQAAIEALGYLQPPATAIVYTDSRVLLEAVNRKNKRAPAHPDQFAILQKQIQQNSISWQWVKAHSGKVYNERCDELCIRARLT